jgi:hypothetical protein
MLQHIALEIREKDLQDFYIGILGGILENQVTLREEDASNIFQIDKKVPVYFLKINDLTLELFVNEATEHKRFQHVCISHENALQILQKAKEKEYWTFLRKKEKGCTCFIRDANSNMFEIKNKELQ